MNSIFPNRAFAACRRAALLAALSLLPSLGFAGGAEFGDASSNSAKNIARMNCGAMIQAIAPDGRTIVPGQGQLGPAVLIADDSTLSWRLDQGETTFVINLARTSLLDRFTFVNHTAAAEGDVLIAVSNYQLPANSPRWTTVSSGVAFSSKREFDLPLVGVEARYVKVQFRVRKPGEIAAFGLYGGESLQAFAHRRDGVAQVSNTVARKRMGDMLNFNFANLYARGQVVFVSSGAQPTARRMIDDDTTTSYEFDRTDPNPTMIVELAESERIHRVSALYTMQNGRMDVYLLDKLASDPEDMSGARLVASANDNTGSGKAAVQFDPAGARYVAFRWTPAERPKDGGAFEVAEVSAFGEMPVAILDTYAAPELFASNALDFTGERGVDFSNKLGTLADPPILAEVSP